MIIDDKLERMKN